MIEQIVRGPLLSPSAEWQYRVLCRRRAGVRQTGDSCYSPAPWKKLQSQLPANSPLARISEGVILPPLLDLHTHIPQHPIRGRFAEGVSEDAPGGRLLNALKRNVFPAESEVQCRRIMRDR